MSDASDTQRCGRCGTEFTATSTPLGLCPACVLKLGISDLSMAPVQEPEAEPAAPPAPAPPPLPPPPVARRLRPVPPWAWMTAAAVLVLAMAASYFSLRSRSEPASGHANLVRFTLALPDEAEMLDGAQFAVSADGTHLVVAARRVRGPQRLWVRRLQSLEWREMPGTDGATFPFWSPDSRHIGFFAGRRLRRIEVANDLTQTLCDVRSGQGGTWGTQHVIVFADAAGLSRVPDSGGTPVPVTKVDGSHGQRAHLWPHFLPDGRRFIFLVQTTNEEAATHIGQIDGGGSVAIANGHGPAAFAAKVLLFSRGGTLATQQFDPAGDEMTGEVETLGGIDDVAGSTTAGPAFSASSTVLVYRRGVEPKQQLTWIDRTGRPTGVVGEPADYTDFALSPDGRRVAFARRGDDGTSSVWLMDMTSDRLQRLHRPATGRDGFPLWSPDGSRIAFSSRGNDGESVHAIAAATGESEELLIRSPESRRLTGWSPDSRFLIYGARSEKTGMDLWILSIGDRKPRPLQQTPADESQGRWSPDGRWIAYVSDESGEEEVYARPVPPSEGRWQISSRGGTHPRWSADGREIYFLSPEGQLMAVEVRTAQALQLGAERLMLHLRGAGDFAVSPDGRFLVPVPVDEGRDRQLQVVLNWAAELRR